MLTALAGTLLQKQLSSNAEVFYLRILNTDISDILFKLNKDLIIK